MNLFMLLQRARERLEKGSPEFSDSADTICRYAVTRGTFPLTSQIWD